MGGPEPSGELPLTLLHEPRHVPRHDRAHLHARQRIASTTDRGEDGPDVRPLTAHVIDGRGRLAREQETRGPRVVGVGMGHRPDEAQSVGARRELGEVLADLDAGHGRRDRPELAAHLARCVGLGIPRLELRRPAPHEEKDAALRPAEARLRRQSRGCGTPAEQSIERQAEHPQRAELKQPAAVIKPVHVRPLGHDGHETSPHQKPSRRSPTA